MEQPAQPEPSTTEQPSVEVFIASDHRGYEAKNRLVATLNSGALSGYGFTISDLGPFELAPDDDYNDVATAVARAVKNTPGSRGILLCGSGNGVCIQANRFGGIRAIAPTLPELAKLGREHNDANVLCLSADFLTDEQQQNLVQIFLTTPFSKASRHARRVARLDAAAADNQTKEEN